VARIVSVMGGKRRGLSVLWMVRGEDCQRLDGKCGRLSVQWIVIVEECRCYG